MRYQARRSNGLSIMECPSCGRFNPFPACVKKPDTCHACGFRLTPVAADAERQQALGDDESRPAEHDG